MPSYTTLTEFKVRIGETGSSNDTYLTAVLNGSERAVETYLGYDPSGSATYTHYFDTDGSPLLVLGLKNVTSITNVYESVGGYYGTPATPFGTETELESGVGYAWRNNAGTGAAGVLVRLNGVWPTVWFRPVNRLSSELAPCRGSVKVVYVSGGAVPADIVQAAYLEAAAVWGSRQVGLGTQTSSSLDGRSVSINPFAISGAGTYRQRFVSPLAETILRPYRKTCIGSL